MFVFFKHRHSPWSFLLAGICASAEKLASFAIWLEFSYIFLGCCSLQPVLLEKALWEQQQSSMCCSSWYFWRTKSGKEELVNSS